MKILTRYLWREFIHFGSIFFFVFSFLLTFIMGTLNLREFVVFAPSIIHIVKIYLLTFFQLFSYLLPQSSFFSLLFTFQKLKEDREILALFSLGFTIKDLLKPLFLFIGIIFILTFLSHFFILPYAKRLQKEIQINIVKGLSEYNIPIKKPLLIAEGFYLYVKDSKIVENKHFLQDLLILEKRGERGRGIYLAKEALLEPKTNSISLKEGWAFFQDRLQEFEIYNFKEYFIALTSKSLEREELYFKRGELTFEELREKLRETAKEKKRYYRYLSEYYQRIFYSFSLIPLLLQAFLLGLYLKPHNRFILFLGGISFYLIYYWSYTFLISLGERGSLFPLTSHLLFNGIFYLILLIEWQTLKRRGFLL
ncbi:MAG: LptF/LptG family permease [Caldimicrobium sp.]|nr:LptF/LptG family permease [Caldimicrobium sp.]MCX7872920.1 LptF/LptG family permease [Caldimicrobium sp.]MDW8094479.1 LptF/LptG family permease [Caldimicrobium sp.]